MPRRLSLLPLLALFTTVLLAPQAPAHADGAPATRLFFLADTNLDGETTGLFRSNADGTGRVAMVPERSGVYLNNLVLSSDGSRLAYQRFDAKSTQIWTISAAGFDNRLLKSFGPDNGFRLGISPDNSQLVYTNTHAATSVVSLLSIATGAVTVVPRSTNVMHPTFDPSDATRLYGSINNDRIVTMPVSGAHSPTVLSPSTHKADYPVVSRDGSKLLYEHLEADDTADEPDETLNLMTVADGTTRLASSVHNSTRGSFSQDGQTIYFDHFSNADTDFIGDLWSVPVLGPATAAAPVQQTPSIDEYYLSGGLVDTTAPTSSVTDLSVTLNGAHPILRWTLPAADPDAGYAVLCRAVGTAAPASPDNCGGSLYKGQVSTFTDTVTPGQTYSYSVFPVDGYGNVGTSATDVRMTALSSPALKTASGVPTTSQFNVVWPSPGASSYDVVWSTRPGPSYALAPFQAWKTVTTDTSGVFGDGEPTPARQGTAFTLRAVATDAYGNRTLSSSATYGVPIDQTHATFTGRWPRLSATDRYLGNVSAASTTGSTASISMVGSSYRIIGDRCSSCGQFRVYVNGVLKATINSYAAKLSARQPLWVGGKYPTIAARTIKVVVVGTRGHGRVDLDGFVSLR